MKYILSLYIFLFFASCEEIEQVDIINTWKLTETLYDPGDGSGTFQPVESSATIKFFEDGTFETDAFSCPGSNNENQSYTGAYSPDESTLTFEGCEFTYTFEQSGNTLIVNLVCIEPCRLKFKLVE